MLKTKCNTHHVDILHIASVTSIINLPVERKLAVKSWHGAVFHPIFNKYLLLKTLYITNKSQFRTCYNQVCNTCNEDKESIITFVTVIFIYQKIKELLAWCVCIPNETDKYKLTLMNICVIAAVTCVTLSSLKGFFTQLFFVTKDQEQGLERWQQSRLLG